MTLEFVLAQLYAIRNQVDAMILVVQAVTGQAGPATCPHTETVDAGGTFGHPRRQCVQCQAIVTA